MNKNQFSLKKILEWIGVGSIFLGFYAILFFAYPTSSEIALLRTYFNLPKDVDITNVISNRRHRLATPPRLEAIVKFSDLQFKEYASSLNNQTIWQPVVIQRKVTDRGEQINVLGYESSNVTAWAQISYGWVLRWGGVLGGTVEFVPPEEAPDNLDEIHAPDRENLSTSCANFFQSNKINALCAQGYLDYDNKVLRVSIQQSLF